MISIAKAIAEVFSIWVVLGLISALFFGAFASGKKKLAEQVVRRHPRS